MSINLKNVTKFYGLQKAVDEISFKVKTGEIVGFLGPNGAGKTTTMKMITGLLAPNSGEISINNKNVWEDPESVKKITGYLPENNPLYLDMYVTDYLQYVAALQKVEPPHIGEKVKEMVGVCGLDREKHKKIGELSKGYRQRVGLAQALIHDPKILVLDEPTTGLDPNQIVEIRNLIKEAGQEKTVILSTHILSEVEAISDRILIINEGKIVADGSPESLKRASTEGNNIKLKLETETEPEKVAEVLSTIEGVTSVDLRDEKGVFILQGMGENINREVFSLAVKNKWVLLEMTTQETKLEDIFKKLTTN
ncbi:MAG: ATP-binding cassette domain-containing protein [Ignavibacteriales bacterium]|nr:MAG: ATP-binding cassette domain-containing protein [Ignavibacteriaceae bacterium]MBW7872731.1 ATP-binding cassette domain-containing protein [Ignavibacteria bacterium]MCZ2143451.1 ATP-binding cassette domain-containing protein [Ignavibacteriales bacterium]OQY74303.1 MAG: gliding motility-associated ABC transporter ATP-binding subunit GldA [Ignavibacteriales bacterium UTCHB3]MBV6444328.1 Vitamin B12 import ATP-binding protein BtuD [Ignavibacteriaceae bacterium]